MKICTIILLVVVCFCDAYKILMAFGYSGKSIIKLGDAYARILLEAGHEVTYITRQPVKPHKNLHQIIVSTEVKINFTKLLKMKNTSHYKRLLHNRNIGIKVADEILSHENVQNLMYDNTKKFDVVIVLFLYAEVLSGLSAVFNCPFIWASALEVHPFALGLIDEAPNPAYMTDILSIHIPPLTLFQHLKELWVQGFTYLDTIKFFDRQEEIYEKIFRPVLQKRGLTFTSFEKVKYNASLLFSPSHYSFGQAPNLPQNFKMIGGYHISTDDIKPLQGELSVFMDSSVNGVIFFSMGSNLKSKDFPQEILRDLTKIFGALKQSVVWKFEEEMQNVPENIYIIKWAPQMSILAHPNCRLFITHGGLLSVIETIYFGIPIIGIPMVMDQLINVKRAEVKGFGKEVQFSDTLAEDLKVAIDEVLSNPRFAEKAKEISLIYHDRPMPPDKELVHWVEHVVRTRGAIHLRSSAMLVPWYQKVYLDVIVIVIFITFLIHISVLKLRNVLKSWQKKRQ